MARDIRALVTRHWRGTNSLSVNDLPKAVSSLHQAYEYLFSEEARQQEYGASLVQALG